MRPTQPRSTPSPTSATSPVTPCPGTYGRTTLKYSPMAPDRICVSTNPTSAAATRTTACPGPATGSGASAGTSTSGPPKRST